MAKQVMPPAQLELRPTDIKVPDEVLLQISLFAQLKRKPSLDKFPGTLVLRRYRRGDVICRQGDAGWTAFYLLTTEDACALTQTLGQAAPAGSDPMVWQTLHRQNASRLETLAQDPNDPELRQAATARLDVARTAAEEAPGWLGRWLGRPAAAPEASPVSIPIDAPTAIDYETMQAPLFEGEIFGENSCRFGTPRSATIAASRDCFALEMLRNILDQLRKDAAYKAHTDEAYAKQVLRLHARKLSILGDLSEPQFNGLRDQLKLVSFDPGQVLFDEYERAGHVYLILRGMVKVVKKASALLNPGHIRNWQNLAAAVLEGEKEAAGPKRRIWEQLPEPARETCRAVATAARVTDDLQTSLLGGLNEVLKDIQLSRNKEFVPLLASEAFQARSAMVPGESKERSDQDWRRWNRLLLEVVYPNQIRSHRRRVGPDCVLYYCSRGDFIGEQSLFGQPLHAETCLAQGHPKDRGTAADVGPVEVVQIPAAALAELLPDAPTALAKLERKLLERKRQTQEQVKVPVWDESQHALLSEKFQELGLLQGQKLMLVDLDRCTRCDECVRACADTHEDGQTRLFLYGPRFGNYLVPTSCRSCLDPVCMIGCPVGSIHRGDNGQMVIENWCIGCGLCAQQCPYGSIQMSDIGLIAEDAHGWRYTPVGTVGKAEWWRPRFRDRRWLQGNGPFVNDRVFREALAPLVPPVPPTPAPRQMALNDFSLGDFARPESLANPNRLGQALCFRYTFRLSRRRVRQERQFKLTVTSADPDLAVWVNGQQVQPDEKASGGKREYWFPPRPPARDRRTMSAPTNRPTAVQKVPEPEEVALARSAPMPPQRRLSAGRNVLAIQVSPDCDIGGAFLRVRLDEVRQPTVLGGEEVTQKQVTERAVVCDLCSAQPGRVPACVNACPHDAAMRIDARSDFPRG
jgi:Fe-S-cluster-containing hydrogenase component 2/CRP-like cAMP-binding protein